MLIDSHCHVLYSEYRNPEKIIEDSHLLGVDKMIINGYNIKTSNEAIEISKKFDFVYPSVGISPQEVHNLENNYMHLIESMIVKENIRSIGEIGLDYYWTTEYKERQKEVFNNMLSLAQKYNLPVIIHSRNATLDTLEILKKYNVKGIIHCFSGSKEIALEYIKMGFLIGIGGVITFKNAKQIKEVVKQIPIDGISLETDCPYLSPEPLRGKENIPANIVYVAKKIAEIKNITYNEVIDMTSSNVLAKFDLC